MIKNWIQKALDFLNHSLNPISQKLNELDWKEDLSPDNIGFYDLTFDESAAVEGNA